MKNLNKAISTMTESEKENYMWETLKTRTNELLKQPEFMKEYQSKSNEREAKDWAMNQAIFTLIYSPEERKEKLIK